MSRLSSLFSNRRLAAQVAAINRSQAVIEFDLNGMILNANENFLNVLGYTLDEIRGQHHPHVRRSGRAGERGLSQVLGGSRAW
ncbi:PAS domain S-box protein [Bosea sp. 2YAB26]